ncbi:hypothetical protein S40285_06553 [Stachybotrys chlorohalonatus IBT 40285]|uniref:Nucleoporin NUP53 n=1 Tax=Stachybotrys chlorohalonatus (strain IBT 40285) TaxID=1283841 RepID=A0A084QD45_STAC4|nr:hypothetical protein S40285_06553 [Stachybotrys chlorohalonata IBT 40285]
MAPLILHNVPDEECYIGDDGIKRPYAMIFNQQDGHTGSLRSRRGVAETGSFGKSTRRSRSRTGTTPRVRENPTLAAADKLFGDWVANQATTSTAPTVQRKSSNLMQEEPVVTQVSAKSSPMEVILRGYRSSLQQYAAIAHYESLAGVVLEDYPRDAPANQRRYKSELRDPAYTRRRNLTPEQRALVNRADGGEHWIKVTFETTEAGETALFASPQRVLGHMVYAEAYRGIPPVSDEPCPDDSLLEGEHQRSKSVPAALGTPKRKSGGTLPSSFSSRLLDLSPTNSRTSSHTIDSGTLSASHDSSATITQTAPLAGTTTGIELTDIAPQDDIFCRRIPTAKRARLLPAEQALLPQQSVLQRVVNAIPFVKWFGGSMIGNEVPRTETGEFDWNRASLYWKLVWWLDATFGLFSGDVCSADKDD